MHFSRPLLFFVVVICLQTGLRAQPPAALNCPSEPFPQTLPGKKNELLAELKRLDLLERSCGDRSDFFSYKGSILLALRSGPQALEALERALLLAPELPGLQFDYAQALAMVGDRKSASELVSRLIEREDIHPEFKSFLLREREVLSKNQWRWSARASSQLGYESNLNSAPNARIFTLTPVSGEVALELDERSVKRSGMAWLNAFSLSGLTNLSAGQTIYVFSGVRARVSESGTQYQQAETLLDWRGPQWAISPWQDVRPSVRAVFSHLQFDGTGVFQAPRLELGVDRPFLGVCLGRSALVAEVRRFPSARVQDSNFFGFIVSAHCNYGENLFSAQLGAGQDHAKSVTRPGGDQSRLEATFTWSRDLGWGALAFLASNARLRDQAGYSPLLNKGVAREMNRWFTRIELAVPFSSGVDWLASAETSVQNSNISLFDLNSRAVYLGVRARFD